MDELIAGIDLGTTNSEISFMIDGKITVVPVDGDPIMPSCVGIDPSGKIIVGKAAKNQMVSSPELTILSIKRKMGENTKVKLGERELLPQEISALILSRLKNEAESFLGQKVKKAVITAPAYFNDHQRQATLDAGEIAGLDVVRIINEPTAAAVAYEADHTDNQRILVYDLGGGTFDVSLVIVEDGVVEVLSSHGDTHLGGDDFDQLLIDHVFEQILIDHHQNLSNEMRIRRRIWRAAEKAKRELSDRPFASIREEYLTSNINLDLEISRMDYEEMIRPLLNRTLDCIHECLKDASCLPGGIDKILLVGGATRTPLVHSILEREIGKTPRSEINPDLIVSMGAAAQGAVIAGAKSHSILVDITTHTFGTIAADLSGDRPNLDRFVPVIKRNTPLPVSKAEAFETIIDGQDSVDVAVYQGESQRASENTLVGKFVIRGLSNVPAGNIILLNLELNLNGVLKVTATEKSTSLTKTVIMDTKKCTSYDKINAFDINDTIKSLDTAFLQNIDAAEDIGRSDDVKQAKNLKKRAEKLLNAAISSEDAAEIRDLLEKSREAIASGEMALLKNYNSSLEDLVFYLED
jgi:molecular chaperone DnaK